MPKRKKYSFFYTVYRKIRYLRYVRKLRKSERKLVIRTDKLLYAERRKKARKQRKSELKADVKKRKVERQVLKENKAQLKAEYEQDLEKNRKHYEEQEASLDSIRKKEKWFRRHRRRRLIRFYLKSCSRNIILSIKTLNPANLPKLIAHIRDNKISIREFAIITTHSTLFFIAAYLLVFLVLLFSAAISGIFFEYSSIVYYYEVLWMVKPEEWFGDSVKMIYASGPILCAILAVFFAIIFSYMQTEKGLSKLFLLWFFIHAFNAFFGSLLIGSLFGRGFGYAIIWSFISDTEKVIYSIVSITALFLLGVFTTRSFLISANTYYPHLENKQQQKFVWAQVILPFLFGNILLGLIMFPEFLWYDVTVAFTLAICIIPIAIGYRFLPSLYFEEEKPGISFQLRPIILILAFIAIYRIVLEIGIRIG